jgi:hypothetical protein
MSWKITFEIYGEFFSPDAVAFVFNEHNENGAIEPAVPLKSMSRNYGSASYIVPKNIARFERFKHLADTFVPLLDALKNAGATEWHTNISRIYYAQCNEQVDFEELCQIARLKCGFSYSAYSVETEAEETIGFTNS